MLQRHAMARGIEHRRGIHINARILRQPGQRFAGVRLGVTSAQVRDHQRDVGIAPAQLENVAQVVRMAQAGGLGHVQGHPGVALVENFQKMMGQEV